MESALFFWLLAFVLVAGGLLGLFVPALPGAPLIFAGLVLAAWAEDFRYAGLWTIVALALLAVLSFAADFWAALFGAKKFGASRRAGAGALIGLAAGMFIGFPGLVFGPFIGAVAGELTVRKDLRQAARAGIGATLGLALGAALKLALAFTMIGIFLAVRFVT